MSKTIKISSYNLKEEDRFFFDTNIWLYLFCPIGQYRKECVEKYKEYTRECDKNKVKPITLKEFFEMGAK